ncbi:ATP-binding protein [Mesorhizobium sp. B2-3-3]|nr:ATP-binding protein [Mesorhizobium sp. B2-3-3]
MSDVWILVTAGLERGEAASLHVTLSEGVHGESVRRVDFPGGGAELVRSAAHACGEAARILYRERYLDRQILVRFATLEAGSIHGRSAELAFALALVGAAVKIPLPAIAATGLVEAGGAIRGVEGVEAKAAAALKVLPRGGRFIYPCSNDAALSPELRRQAAEADVALTPSHRLEDLLADLGLPIAKTWLDDPYRGLEPFEFGHASIFFGREAEIEELVALLARRTAVLVRGPSGAGKSSLVLAGLLPALLRRSTQGQSLRWGLLRPRDIRPNPAPGRELDLLRATLAASWRHESEGGLDARVDEIPPALDAAAFTMRLRAAGASEALWVVDQFEDVFDNGLYPETIEALTDFLAQANSHGVKIVATITNAALARLNGFPRLADLFGVEGVFALEPRHDAKFLQAITGGPAAAANLSFEQGLDAELIAAASHGGPDVLPLLELLLTELFERRDQATRELRWSDYRAVGGLDGVVSARAELVYSALAPEQQASIGKIIWKLATDGAVETRDYNAHEPIHAAFAAFQGRRLLVRDAAAQGARLRAAHESLLRHWERARTQLQSAEADISIWRELQREARQWSAGKRTLMPSGPQLLAAGDFLTRRSTDFTASDRELGGYVAASLRQRDRRRLLTGLALGLPAAAAGVFGVFKVHDAYEASRLTDVNFDDAPAPAGEYRIAAAPFLERNGLRLTNRSPAESELAILKFDPVQGKGVGFLSRARPIASAGGPLSPLRGMLTQIVSSQVDDLSFSIAFLWPLTSFRALPLSRAALIDLGLVQAAEWELIPLDENGHELDVTAYRASRRSVGDGNSWLVVDAPAGARLHGVKISTYRHSPRNSDPGASPAAEDFDGVHAVLIQKLQMLR